MPVPAAPTALKFYTPTPNPSDPPDVFDTDVQADLNSRNAVVDSLNELGTYVEDTSNLAEGFANTASDAADVALASSNYVGPYSSLGPSDSLTVPTSVSYDTGGGDGVQYWMLRQDLADPTTQTPGSAPTYWSLISTGGESAITTRGDIVTGSSTGTPVRLAIGSSLQVLRVNAAGTDLEYADPTGGDTGSTLSFVDLGTATGSPTEDIDLADGENAEFYIEFGDTGGTVTFTLSNAPSGTDIGYDFELHIQGAGKKSISWPAGWTWNNGITPSLSSTGETQISIRRKPYYSANGATMTVTTQQAIP